MNEADTYCGSCGCLITDEDPSGEPALRKPCPQCGSLARAFSLEIHATVHVSVSAEGTVVTYPQTLLGTCKGLIEDGQFGISVVVAHMACEVSVERALTAAFSAKGIEYLEDPVREFLNGYNLANGRNRKLYTALTDEHIEQQPFWQAFTESATRRNRLVHGGAHVSREEAESSFRAASAFVSYLSR